MAELPPGVRRVTERLDEVALPAIYAAISVPTAGERARFERAGLAYVGRPGGPPDPWQLDRAADTVIGWTRANTSLLGGVAGLAGLLSVPPEVAAWGVAILRMTQRIAVVYGIDPETERGRLVVARAVAAGFDVALPAQGIDGLKVSELFAHVLGQAPTPSRGELVANVQGALVRAVVWRSALRLAGRMGRIVPVVSSGFSAVDNQRRAAEIGQRVKAVVRRMAELPALPGVVDAIEVVR